MEIPFIIKNVIDILRKITLYASMSLIDKKASFYSNSVFISNRENPIWFFATFHNIEYYPPIKV